jgi:hypothetical protein
MRSSMSLALLLYPLAAAAAPVENEEPPALRRVIEKAIRARGGRERLRRFAAITFKATGKLFGPGGAYEYRGEFAEQMPARQWFHMEGEVAHRKLTLTGAIDGTRQWLTANGKTRHLSDAEAAEQREGMYADWMTSLRPLRNRAVRLRVLEEAQVGDRPSVAVEATAKGHRPVKLFFDKESGLLLKSETREKDVRTDKERTREEFYSDYREVQGVKVPMKIEVQRDGRRYSESRRTDVKLLEKLDDKLFAEPQRP